MLANHSWLSVYIYIYIGIVSVREFFEITKYSLSLKGVECINLKHLLCFWRLLCDGHMVKVALN